MDIEGVLLPRIKSIDFLSAIEASGVPEEEKPVAIPLLSGLLIVMAIDRGHVFEMISPRLATEMGLTMEQVFDQSLSNLEEFIPHFQLLPDGDLWKVTVGNDLESCALLLDSFWNIDVRRYVKGPVAIGVPHKSVMLVADSTKPDSMASLERRVSEVYSPTDRHSLTPVVFVRHGNSWKPYRKEQIREKGPTSPLARVMELGESGLQTHLPLFVGNRAFEGFTGSAWAAFRDLFLIGTLHLTLKKLGSDKLLGYAPKDFLDTYAERADLLEAVLEKVEPAEAIGLWLMSHFGAGQDHERFEQAYLVLGGAVLRCADYAVRYLETEPPVPSPVNWEEANSAFESRLREFGTSMGGRYSFDYSEGLFRWEVGGTPVAVADLVVLGLYHKGVGPWLSAWCNSKLFEKKCAPEPQIGLPGHVEGVSLEEAYRLSEAVAERTRVDAYHYHTGPMVEHGWFWGFKNLRKASEADIQDPVRLKRAYSDLVLKVASLHMLLQEGLVDRADSAQMLERLAETFRRESETVYRADPRGECLERLSHELRAWSERLTAKTAGFLPRRKALSKKEVSDLSAALLVVRDSM